MCIRVEPINNVGQFQVNSEGTQPHIYMYPFLPIKYISLLLQSGREKDNTLMIVDEFRSPKWIQRALTTHSTAKHVKSRHFKLRSL